MGAVTGSRPFDRRWDAEIPTRFGEGAHILAPGLPVEVHGQEPAGVVLEQRVEPQHVAALQVTEELGVVERQERLVRAFTAADPRLLTHAAHPLVCARGCVAPLPGPAVLPAARKDIRPTPEQAWKRATFSAAVTGVPRLSASASRRCGRSASIAASCSRSSRSRICVRSSSAFSEASRDSSCTIASRRIFGSGMRAVCPHR